MIHLMEILSGVKHCITIIGKWVFDRNVLFELPINHKYIDNFWIEQDKPNEINGYKGVMKYVRLFSTDTS